MVIDDGTKKKKNTNNMFEVGDKVICLYEKHNPLCLEALAAESIDMVLAFVLNQRIKRNTQ